MTPELDRRFPSVADIERKALRRLPRFMAEYLHTRVFADLRARWPGTLIVKGVLDPEDARRYQDLGAQAIVVSNHGGRQLEAAPSAARMLPEIRKAVGDDYPLIADGGVRTGLDICRMLALGANFVLLGRAFYYSVAAMGSVGAEHVMVLLKAELQCTMGQLGCSSLEELPERLMRTQSQPGLFMKLRSERPTGSPGNL